MRSNSLQLVRTSGIVVTILLTTFASCWSPAATTGPPSTTDNTFYIFALYDGLRALSETQIAGQMDRLREQFGPGNTYHHVGFALIIPSTGKLREICRVAQQKHLNVGVVLAVQDKPHEFEPGGDLRSYQWRLDPTATRGQFAAGGRVTSTLSRYCKPHRDAMVAQMTTRAAETVTVMRDFPGIITVVNGSIEAELAGFPPDSKGDEYLADYSPFAVEEFRDWLRHTALYDDVDGPYAGQGAPEAIVGPFVTVHGKSRARFFNDPDPDHSASAGKSFNSTFGTHFKTWKLRYWDPDAFPAPITDRNFDPAPPSGPGALEGGFDAPRKADDSAWWKAWTWDVLARGKSYPPGNPTHPAFGFRQFLVEHFVQDMLKVAAGEGIPPNLLFAHQVPGEALDESRDVSSASPVWSGFSPFNGTVGITRFGPINPKFLSQYTDTDPQSRGWGIFEWHPLPDAKRDDPKLYEATIKDLRTYYHHGAHYLFAGWWSGSDKHPEKETFPLDDSNFAKGIKDFLATCPDRPYPGAASLHR